MGTSIIRFAVHAICLTLVGSVSADPAALEGHSSLKAGPCLLELPHANAGAAGELSRTCREAAYRIFRQLGQSLDDDGRIRVRLVDDPARMNEAAPVGMAPPAWSGAVAYPGHDLVILSLRNRDGSPARDLRVTMEHELSHLALYRALPDGVRVPRWFSEGIAIQQSEGSSMLRDGMLRWAAAGGTLLPLSAIERYPESTGRIHLAYAQAADFVGYLLADGGWTGIRALLDRLARGQGFEEAFAAVYGLSLAAAEGEWRASLGGNLGWVVLLTGSGALWGAITVLFVFAVLAARRRKRRRLEAMAIEEEPVQRLIETFEQLKRSLPQHRPHKPSPEHTPPAKVVVEGRIHTLH